METWKDDNPKNLYVIKHKLANYKMLPGEDGWSFRIDNFILTVQLTQDDTWKLTNGLVNRSAVRGVKIIDFEKFNIHVREATHKGNPSPSHYINLTEDIRFKDYKPIQYNVVKTPAGGCINRSDGKEIPLLQLMELISYLHRLSNLTAFF